MENEDVAILEIPGGLPPNISELADEMTDKELKAMVIIQTKLLQETVAFVREVKEFAAQMQGAGPMGMMKALRQPKPGVQHIPTNDPMAEMRKQAEAMGIAIPGM